MAEFNLLTQLKQFIQPLILRVRPPKKFLFSRKPFGNLSHFKNRASNIYKTKSQSSPSNIEKLKEKLLEHYSTVLGV